MIVLIDDNLFDLFPWVNALRGAGFDCAGFTDMKTGLAFVEKRRDEVQAVVVDAMMPIGSYDFAKTQGGLSTGVVGVKDLLSRWPDMPVVMLTVCARVSLGTADIPRGVAVVSKALDMPEDLVKAVKDATCQP